jgi:PEP-CTERM motif
VTLSPGEVYATAELTPGGPAFGLGGFGAESDGSGTSLTYDATADLTFLTTTTEDIFLNLTSGIGSLPAGDTFSLVFSYDINGDGVVNSPTFTSLAAADAYFNGMAIDLGNFDAGTQSLDLTYAFTAMGDPPSYEITYDIAGTSVAPTVPEPSTWAMMLIGFGGLGYMSWRRANRAKAAAA